MLTNVRKLDDECTGECVVSGCGREAFPYGCDELLLGYVDACRFHARVCLEDALRDQDAEADTVAAMREEAR